jgi:hypothetical protein
MTMEMEIVEMEILLLRPRRWQEQVKMVQRPSQAKLACQVDHNGCVDRTHVLTLLSGTLNRTDP